MELTRPVATTMKPQKKSTKNGARATNFCWTLNNYTEEEVKQIKGAFCGDHPIRIVWLIFGKEIAPTTGTPHLQGACCIGRQVAFSTISRTWPGFKRVSMRIMGGTPLDSLSYCSKEDTNPFQYGVCPISEQGKRNDLVSAIERVLSGSSMRQIANSGDMEAVISFVKHHKGLTLLRSATQHQRQEPPTVVWLYGHTGTGKTRAAIELGTFFGPDEWWISAGGLQWFDGYDGQTVAILDDFRTKHCEFSMLLRILDRYSLRVPFKGGFIDWLPRYIVVTAPMEPKFMYNLHRDEDIKQLERRCTHIIHLQEEDKDFSLLRELGLKQEVEVEEKKKEEQEIYIPTSTSAEEIDRILLEPLAPTLTWESEDLSDDSWDNHELKLRAIESKPVFERQDALFLDLINLISSSSSSVEEV